MRKLLRALLPGLSLAILAACGGGGSSSSGAAPFNIFVSPTSATVDVGSIRQFSAEARNSAGQVVGGQQFAWSSSDSNIAQSLGNGRFKGIAPGSVQVTASAAVVEKAGQGPVRIVSNAVVLSVATAVAGTAAQGAPLAGASVSLRDARGQYAAASTDATGHFEVPVAGMTAPFLLKVATPDGRVLYGSAAGLGTANLDPYSDLLVRDWYVAHGSDADMAFAGQGPLPTIQGMALMDKTLSGMLEDAFTATGVPAHFSLLGSPFSADHTGFDGLLDQTQIDLKVGRIQVAGQSLELHPGTSGRLDWAGAGRSGTLQVP
ncbi:MAG TPA: Ig-like domain-containing protein [Gammaproteobacteria bacterium]|jgi:hypothetical protein